MNIETQFTDVVRLIREAQAKAMRTVNTQLIDLYWNIGEYISERVQSQQWGQSVVIELSRYLQETEPDLKGFSDKNLWRMKQFYECYREQAKLSSVMREISWTHNLVILSRAKTIEEKEFYLRLCARERFSVRELERQFNSGTFERTMLGTQNSHQ